MPITDNGFEYDMPEKYKQMITADFLQTMKDELKKEFQDYSFDVYQEWEHVMFTSAWYDSFKTSAARYGLKELNDYYSSLEWHDSDMFDSDLIDLAEAKGIITHNGYKYDIPDKYKQMITADFLQDFKNEFKKIFQEQIQDQLVDSESDDGWAWATYITDGWNKCFETSAVKHGVKELYDYYSSLEWYDSDMFDSYLIDIAVAMCIINKS
jgi:hypothetical protein